MFLEPLEKRILLAAEMRFAVIGDFGSSGQPEQDVSALVKGWNPNAVITVGDNNFPDGLASEIDANVGQYYHEFIYPYLGSYGAGSADGQNHFWPALGNHDWEVPGAQPHLDYFTLPGNERYYTIVLGSVEFFILDTDPGEPDGNTADSVQGQWLHQQMLASTATWKLVIGHHNPYSSGSEGNLPFMRWPFTDWGATAAVWGHDHDYERLEVGGLPHFISGAGGVSLRDFLAPVEGSQVRFNADYGALLITASETYMTFQFITRTGQVIDYYTIGQVVPPAAPAGLAARPLAYNEIGLSWSDNSSDENGFVVERSIDGLSFAQVGVAPTNSTSYTDRTASPATQYTYRVRAMNSGGQSAYSNTASATTFDMASVVFVSDLNWISATNGWGPVEKDMSNGSSAAGDGRTMMLNGLAYGKGLGVHAPSEILYDLGGHYVSFVSDIGIDDEKTDGSVTFQVIADGRALYDSGLMTGSSQTRSIDLSVTGVIQLLLRVTDDGNGIDADHADWAGAHLLRSAIRPPANPTALAAIATGLSRIALRWQDNSSDETFFLVERSVDGIHFSEVATLPADVTIYNDRGLATNMRYAYRVRASNGGGVSGYTEIVSSATLDPLRVRFLSDMTWSSARNGDGPVEKDMSSGGSGAGDGTAITLNGITFDKGIGTSANCRIEYNLSGPLVRFQSDIGVDDEVGSGGSVVFRVMLDGRFVYNSGPMNGASETRSIDLPVLGAKKLILVVTDNRDGRLLDHADWAGARFTTMLAAPQAVPVPKPESRKIGISVLLTSRTTLVI